MAWAAAAQARDEDLFIRPSEQYSVLFGSLDVGRSQFASVGAKQTLTGPLDRTGFVAMESSGYGFTRERFRSETLNLPATRLVQQNALLAGHQWALDGLYVAAYLGPEVKIEQLTIQQRVLRWSEPRTGLRGQAELWAHPTPELLVTGTLVVGTARTSLWGRASTGIQVAKSTYVGPEITVYATPTYTETRLGGHVTGLSLGLLKVRASVGWMVDDDHRRGSLYTGLTAWMRL